MPQQTPLTDEILKHVRGSPDCSLETLVSLCPEFTWRQILFEVARLSRMGQVRITSGAGLFNITPQLEVRASKPAVRRRRQPRKSIALARSDH